MVERLGEMAVDLVELSGGSYESPAMQGRQEDGTSTGRREAYFVDFAREIAGIARMPIMVTGGIRSREVAEDALVNERGGIGVSVLGIARAMAFEPDIVENWRQGRTLSVAIPEVSWKNKRLAGFASMVLAYVQLERMALGKAPRVPRFAFVALMRNQMQAKRWTKRYRAWREG